MVAVVGFLFLAITAATRFRGLVSHPVFTGAVLIGAVAYVTSGYALSKLASRAVANPARLWSISLGSNVVIIAIVAAAIGLSIGLVICLPEIIAVLVHLIALATQPSRQRSA